MKYYSSRLIVYTLLFFLIIPFACKKEAPDKIVGEWVGVNNRGGKVSFFFNVDSTFTMVSGNEVFGGEDGEFQGENIIITYSTNYNTKPYQIDTIPKVLGEKSESDKITGIFEFISENKIRILIPFENANEIPKDFSNKYSNQTMVIERVQVKE